MKNVVFKIFFLSFLFLLGLAVTRNRPFLERTLFNKYILPQASRIKDLKFEFSLLIRGESKRYPTWKVSTSKNNYLKLQSERANIFNGFLLTGEQFKGSDKSYGVDVVSARNYSSRAELKLFGMNPDHYRDPSAHSFRLKYKNALFYGKRKENFLKPATRTYGIDHLWNVIFYNMNGGLRFDYEPIRVLFNNIDYGFYYKEPFFDKYFIELNRFRDGEILEIYQDSIKVNHLPDYKEISEFNKLLTIEDYDLLSIVDIEMLCDAFAISILSGSNHALRDINLHWYHNPVINKLQPTIREVGSSKDISVFLKDGTNPNLISELLDYMVKDNPFLKKIYQADKDYFQLNIYNALYEVIDLFKDDTILNEELVKEFLNYNPVNNKFLEYYNRIKSNINDLKPILGSDQGRSEKNRKILEFHGDVIFQEDIIFENSKIEFKPNTNVVFRNSPVIKFVNCEIDIGNQMGLTVFDGGDSGGSMIFVESEVQITNTQFKNLKNPDREDALIPSSITFYQSSVGIASSIFEQNQSGDDFLNFFRCDEVTVENSSFLKNFADAIDSDFSNIKIVNNSFLEIGNDAIDLSGSSAMISNNVFTEVGDKAISAGEASAIIVNSNAFNLCEIAVVCKDGSNLNSKFNSFKNNKIEFVFFNKKPVYGFPTIDQFIEDNQIRVLSDYDGSINKVNGLNVEISIENDVESMLYGNLYGKASK